MAFIYIFEKFRHFFIYQVFLKRLLCGDYSKLLPWWETYNQDGGRYIEE